MKSCLTLVVDTSSSMKGPKIGAANDAAVNIIQIFQDCASKLGLEAEISVITFSDSSVDGLNSEAESFAWNDVRADGLTSFGEVCLHLKKSLEERSSPDLKETLVMISDGAATDDYTDSLCRLLSSPAFHRCLHLSVAIHKFSDPEVLEYFSGDSTLVFTPETIEKMEDLFYKFNQQS